MAEVLGNGIYTITEAAWLLGISRQRVAAYFAGWPRRATPLLRSDYSDMLNKPAISFLNFVDTAVAATLTEKHNVPVGLLRTLRDKLIEKWNTPHPFSTGQFYTDDTGRMIFCEIADESVDARLMEVMKDQYAMRDILVPVLRRVEYSAETNLAQSMFLTSRILLDPQMKYGKPTVRGTGIPASILHECYEATKSYDCVADWYNVDQEDVRAAVDFYATFRGIAA